MPWMTLWVEPIPFTTHLGVTVYPTDDDLDAKSGFHRYRFTTSKNDADTLYWFDVRELLGTTLGAQTRLHCDDPDAEHAVIRELVHSAIERGILKADEELSC